MYIVMTLSIKQSKNKKCARATIPKKMLLSIPVAFLLIAFWYGLYLLLGEQNAQAYYKLYRYGIVSSKTVQNVMMQKVKSSNIIMQETGLRYLKNMGAAAKPTVPELITMLKKNRTKLFYSLFQSLNSIDSSWIYRDKDLFMFFIKTQLEHNVRSFYAVDALKKYTPKAGFVVPKIPKEDIKRLVNTVTMIDSYFPEYAVFTLNRFVPKWKVTPEGIKTIAELTNNLYSDVHGKSYHAEKILKLIHGKKP